MMYILSAPSMVCLLGIWFVCPEPSYGDTPEPEPTELIEKIKNGNHVRVSPDSRILAVSGYRSGVSLWELPSGKKIGLLASEGATAIEFSGNGKRLVCGHRLYDEVDRRWKGRVIVFDVSTHQQVVVLENLLEQIHFVDYHPTADTVGIICSRLPPSDPTSGLQYYQAILLWDIASKKVRFRMEGRHQEIRFSTKGDKFFSLDVSTSAIQFGVKMADTCHPCIFDSFSGKQLRSFQSRPIIALAQSCDRATYATTGLDDDTEIAIWNIFECKKVGTLPRREKGIPIMAFTLGSRLLACAEDDCAIQIWDVQERKLLGKLETKRKFPEGTTLTSLTFSPNGEFMITATRDGSVHIWNVRTYLKQMMSKSR